MKTRKDQINEAIRYAASDEAHDPERWREARRIIVKAGLCSGCACDGRRVKLGPWIPGNATDYAGRECPECNEFEPCGEQPEYEGDCYGGAVTAGGMVVSDADPGL